MGVGAGGEEESANGMTKILLCVMVTWTRCKKGEDTILAENKSPLESQSDIRCSRFPRTRLSRPHEFHWLNLPQNHSFALLLPPPSAWMKESRLKFHGMAKNVSLLYRMQTCQPRRKHLILKKWKVCSLLNYVHVRFSLNFYPGLGKHCVSNGGAHFTGMSASIPAVTSLRDLSSAFISLQPSSSTPNRKSSLPLSADESTPWHPTAFADSATQGNQDGYRVSTLRPGGDPPDVSIRGNIRQRNLVCLQFQATSDASLFLEIEKIHLGKLWEIYLESVEENFKIFLQKLRYSRNVSYSSLIMCKLIWATFDYIEEL